ncbi:40S ribosomal protein S17 [Tanacetum coccineum]
MSFGPVRGISLKLQEEERDRCMDFVPDESAIRTDVIEVDKETIDMLVALGMGDLPGVVKAPEAVVGLTTKAVPSSHVLLDIDLSIEFELQG